MNYKQEDNSVDNDIKRLKKNLDKKNHRDPDFFLVDKKKACYFENFQRVSSKKVQNEIVTFLSWLSNVSLIRITLMTMFRVFS